MSSKYSVLHGPVNIGGIGGFLSAFEKHHGLKSEFVVFQRKKNIDNCDYSLEIQKYPLLKRWIIRLSFFSGIVFKYDIFHFYFGVTWLPLNLDLPILKVLGKKMIMTYCGSDVRLFKDVEQKHNPYWKLHLWGLNNPSYDINKKIMMKFQGFFVDRVIAIRDIYDYAFQVIPKKKIIKNIWINNMVVNGDDLYYKQRSNKEILIVHAPSNTNIKGTKYIERTIKRIQLDGYKFKYQKVQGLCHKEAKKILHQADIIIDQILLGAYGNVAVEGMSLGKPVICYLTDHFIKKYASTCPIVNASINNLYEKLVELIDNKELRIKLGREGSKYAKIHFDQKKIGFQVIRLYETLLKK